MKVQTVVVVTVGTILLAGGLFVVEERGVLVRVGEPAPDFSAMSHNGERIRLSDYRGKKNVVLYFYPKDFTAGCTEQACALRDNFQNLRNLDAVVLGISADDVQTHRRFASSCDLPFLLLSDSGKTIIKAYGARWLRGLVPFTKRVTYIIDKYGIVRDVIHHEVIMHEHVEDALKSLERLRSDRAGV